MSTDRVQMSQWPSDHRYVIPVAPGPDVVTITVDGAEVQVPRGELLIKAAQQHGTYIPRFCWHERMKPVGMCRMCLVQVEGMRGLQIACATPVVDGMVVNTKTDTVKAAQDGVLEFLLVNHPLDCPVCDRGGECPLQDQTLAFGPGESRFVEEKRHFEKPIAISDLVLLDRERCIQCGRCTRFAAEVAGDPLIDFGGRGGTTEVITYPDQPFTSYFSGNTVQICPVGALTASSYRFRARPWDLQTVETSCQTCAVGCRGALQSTSNRVVRLLGVDSEPVNHGWLCDKGRYGIEWVHADRRVRSPMRRDAGTLVPTSWPEALDVATAALQQALDTSGPGAIAVLGGARGTNEDAYVWARSRRVCSAPTTSTRSSPTACPPKWCSACRAPSSPISTARAASCSSGPTSRKSCRCSRCASGAPPWSSTSRSWRSRRAPPASPATPPRCCATLPVTPAPSPRRWLGRSPVTAPHRATGRSSARSRRSTGAMAPSWWCSAGHRWPSRPRPPCRPRPRSPGCPV